MTGPALAKGRNGRRYVWPPEEPYELEVPSVTTILNNLSKPALPNWAAKAAAEFAVNEVLSWEKLPADAAIDLIKRAPWRESKGKMDLGSAVHAAIEARQNAEAGGGEPPMIEADLVPYVAAAVQFLDAHVEKVGAFEETVFNATYKYAGTMDVLARLHDGSYAVIDWKTGKAIYPEVVLQTTAYARGEFIGRADGTRINLDYPITKGVAVHLKDDATYTAHVFDITDRAWKTFLALRTLQKWRDDHEQTSLGETIEGSATETAA